MHLNKFKGLILVNKKLTKRQKLIIADLKREQNAKNKEPNIYIEDGVVICDTLDESWINANWLNLTEAEKKFIDEQRLKIDRGEKI